MLDRSHPSPVQPAAQVPPAGAPGPSVQTAAIVLLVVVTGLYFGRDVLVPITLAMLLSFVLAPLVDLLRRAWLGHMLSVILAVILALGILIALGTVIGAQVAELGKDIPRYQATVEQKIERLQETTTGLISGALNRFHRQLGAVSGAPGPGRAPPSGAPAQSPAREAPAQKPVPVQVVQPTPPAIRIGAQVLSPILHPIATAGIILVVTVFTLLQKEDLRDRAIRLFGSGDLQRTTVAMSEAGSRLSRYFLTQLGINTSFGVIVGIGLYVIGVPNPVLWGILGVLLRFIPYIGSYIAALLPIALAAAVAPGWSMAGWTAVLYVVTELAMGQLVEPLVYGHTTGLSPLAVIIAAIFWTWVWGAIGLIISTPLTLCLVVLGRHVEHLEFLDVLLGDRPALSPVESFYQRMLAGDPDEALEHAEAYLKERPLSSYYDEVALEGLRLAAHDARRDALSPSKVERLNQSIGELVHDLRRYDDRSTAAGGDDEEKRETAEATDDVLDKSRLPQEWQGEAPVLCIAGRGPLDEAVASMLAQLLQKHGLGARVVPHEAVARARINELDVRGVAMACVCSVEISGSPAHLRYLLERLRARLPDASLLVGLWPPEDSVLRNEALGRTMGADCYVSTLHDAVTACLDTARRGTCGYRPVRAPETAHQPT